MLKQLFIYPFLKKWVVYAIGHLSFAIFLSIYKGQITGFTENIVVIFSIIAVCSPFFLFYVFDHFGRNIKWMINSYYSRKNLILFHLLHQSIKGLLILFPLIFYSQIDSDVSDEISFGFGDSIYWQNGVYIIVPLALLFITPLIRAKHGGRIKHARRIDTISRAKVFLISFLVFLFAVATFAILKQFGDSKYFMTGFFMQGVIVISLAIFSEGFTLWKTRRLNNAIGLFFSLYLVISIIHLFITRSMVQDPDVLPSKRIDGIIYMNQFGPDLDRTTLHGLLKDVDKSEYIELLEINIDKMDFKFVADNAFEKKLFVHLLRVVRDEDYHLKKTDYIVLLDKFVDFAGSKRLKENLIREIHVVLMRKSLLDIDVINRYFRLGHPFPQYLALELVFHNVPKDKWWDTLKPYREKLDLKLVKRCFDGEKPEEYFKYVGKKEESSK